MRVRAPAGRTSVGWMVVLALAVLVAAWAGGGATGAQESEPQGSEPQGIALRDYGPTRKAPGGGELPGRASTRRWRYIGTLGKLGNNEEVVPKVIARPPREAGRAPLTGLKTKRSLNRPALVVKIDNVAPARPQTAINQADIVYEELVEAGATRLAAVFHSTSPSLIGPVRSARTTDIGIAVSFNRPIFAYSGANSIVDRLVARARVVNRGAEVYLRGYFRSGGRPAPHNLYTRASTMWNSSDGGKPPPAHFAYRPRKGKPAPDVPTAHTIQLKFQRGRGTSVRYEWDARVGGWRRWQNNRAHVDSAGVQVAPENVVVQIVPYADTGMTDKFREDLYEAQMVGTGEALVFTAGHVIEATWTKPTLRSVTTFTDANGEHVRLTRGQTWVALVPPGGVSFNAARCKGRIATIVGTPGDDTIRGSVRRDIIAANSGDDVVVGRGGNDIICGGAGDDRIFGQADDDTIFAGPGADLIRGGAGDDRLNGGGGPDQITGDAGVDTLQGRAGPDQLIGQTGVDRFAAGSGDIVLWGE